MNEKINELIISSIEANEEMIDLGIANPSQPLHPAIKKALLEAKSGYGKNEGEDELREAIANRHSCTLEETLVCLGSTNGLSLFFEACLNEGDEVLILNPSYPVYKEYCKTKGVVPIFVDLNKYFQIDNLSKHVSPKTRALIVNTPHNPSGCLLDEKSMQLISELPDDLYLVFDNVYEEMSNQKIDYSRFKQKVIRIHSFSKLHSMCEFRVGYVIANQAIIKNMAKVVHLTYAGVSRLIQKAALVSLDIDENEKISYYQELKQYAYHRLTEMGLDCVYGEGPFYLFPSIKRFHLTSTTFTRLLKECENVLLVPGSVFLSDHNIRIACCSDRQTLVEGLDRLERFIEKYENL